MSAETTPAAGAGRSAAQVPGQHPRAHLPASEQTIREHLRELPDWMIEECLLWTRAREARGWQFTSGTAAAIHWLDDAQRPVRAAEFAAAGQAGRR